VAVVRRPGASAAGHVLLELDEPLDLLVLEVDGPEDGGAALVGGFLFAFGPRLTSGALFAWGPRLTSGRLFACDGIDGRTRVSTPTRRGRRSFGSGRLGFSGGPGPGQRATAPPG